MGKLIVCIDGLGKDLVSKENTPFLYEFGKEHYSAELDTFFAFTGLEYSFFSGKSPREIDVWLEFVRSNNSVFDNFLLRFFSFNKKLRDYFGVFLQKIRGRTWLSGLHNIPSDKLKFFDTSVVQGLWKLDFFKSRNFVFYKWPFFVTKKGVLIKEKIIFNYEDDEQRLSRLLEKRGAGIYYTQLLGVDKVVHKFGKKSREVREALKKMDDTIREYVGKFLDGDKEGEVFLWSDHGFSDIENYIDIGALLPKRKDYTYFIAGTTVSFWFGNKDVEEEVRKILGSVRGVQILDDKTSEKYGIPLSRKYGDLVFFVSKGDYFFPNFYQKSLGERFVSMHGYPDNRELNGFLLSNGKIPKRLRMDDVLKYMEK
jgi:hypothetical protein